MQFGRDMQFGQQKWMDVLLAIPESPEEKKHEKNNKYKAPESAMCFLCVSFVTLVCFFLI